MNRLRNRLLSAAIAIIALSLVSGCVTRNQVRSIVTDTNSAMASPYIDVAVPNQPGGWEAVVASIDDFIAAHPDDEVLVNHLRVRQAMLFTVNKKKNLADMRWDSVDRTKLKNTRDLTLESCGKQLAWFYEAASEEAKLGIADAEAALAQLTKTIESTEVGSDLRVYLSTIRAQLQLRMGRDSLMSDPPTELRNALRDYVNAIGADDTWLSDVKGLDEASARLIMTFRHRIWLKGLIREYKQAAEDLELPTIPWEPEWVR